MQDLLYNLITRQKRHILKDIKSTSCFTYNTRRERKYLKNYSTAQQKCPAQATVQIYHGIHDATCERETSN